MATVKALQYHTHAGKEYHEGDVYEIDDALVDTITVQGKAIVSAPVMRAPRQRTKALKPTAKGRLTPLKAKKAGKAKK